MEHLNFTQLCGLLHGRWIDICAVMLGWALNIFFLPVLAQMRWPKSKQVPKREVSSSCWAAGSSHAGSKLTVSVYVLQISSRMFETGDLCYQTEALICFANDTVGVNWNNNILLCARMVSCQFCELMQRT